VPPGSISSNVVRLDGDRARAVRACVLDEDVQDLPGGAGRDARRHGSVVEVAQLMTFHLDRRTPALDDVTHELGEVPVQFVGDLGRGLRPIDRSSSSRSSAVIGVRSWCEALAANSRSRRTSSRKDVAEAGRHEGQAQDDEDELEECVGHLLVDQVARARQRQGPATDERAPRRCRH
jgi:hypothetical protein